MAETAREVAGSTSSAVAFDSTTFASLLHRAKNRDEAAFAELYRFAVRPVYRYLSARIGPAEVVEELTEDVFMAAFAGMKSLRAEDENSLLAWLFQIARHKLADHLREKYRHPTVPLDAAETIEDRERPPDEIAEALEEQSVVRAALEQLTPEQREVVVCKYVLGYDNERTARMIGKNANAVNQLHHRALASLHRLLGKDRSES